MLQIDKTGWKIIYDKFRPQEERLREALCTLGNGYMGVRGANPEAIMTKSHYPGTYLAGVYNKLSTQISGRTVVNEDLVNCPNWLFTTFRIGEDEWMVPETQKILFFRQELDMRSGVLSRKIRIEDEKKRRMTIETERFVHMADPHRAALRYTVIPENFNDWIVIKTTLDGAVKNRNVERYKDLNSEHIRKYQFGEFGRHGIYLVATTSQSNIHIYEAAKMRILYNGRETNPQRDILTKEKRKIFQEFRVFARKGNRYTAEKIVAVYSSRDKHVTDPLKEAIHTARSSYGYDQLLKTHRRAWDMLWNKCDVRVKGDLFSQCSLRFHIFHILQTASPHNRSIDAGLPARGLHGEAYRGHIFWDSIFAMHFFDLHGPDTSKGLLLYRYNRLTKARKYARENGYKGAMYPWQSGSSGDEETQELHLNPKSGKWGPDHSRIQRHVSFAIAYNVYRHWKMTGDKDFLINYGAEMLLSIAQFGASLAKFDPKDERYHTQGIMGPDEFHEKHPGHKQSGYKDNAYTNILIVWTMLKAEEVLEELPDLYRKQLLEKIGLTKKDFFLWEGIARKMKIGINKQGVISQFEGYFSLKELNWMYYRVRYGDVKRLDRILKAEGVSPNLYKVAKQADVLMLFYLFSYSELRDLFRRLGYYFDRDTLRINYDYYIKRTSHGSTLSKVVHGYLSHVLGKNAESWRWFMNVMKSDMYDTQGGTTPEGVHIGVMGGSIDIVMRRFAGVELFDDKMVIDPRLPSHWTGLRLKVLYRQHWVQISITKKRVSVHIERSGKGPEPLPVEICDKPYTLLSGKVYTVPIRGNYRFM